MNRIIAVVIFLLFHAFSFGQELQQKWLFAGIENNIGEAVIPINSEKDYLQFTEATFHYELEAKDNLVATGEYTLNDNNLVFLYKQPTDTIRTYKITEHTDSSLVFTENTDDYTVTCLALDKLDETGECPIVEFALEPSCDLISKYNCSFEEYLSDYLEGWLEEA